MSKRRKRRRTIRGHVFLGPVDDPGMARASCELDAAADKRWFREHPNAEVRERPASPLEVVAMALAPGTTVQVHRLPDGTQMRFFVGPAGS
jgi:hypothetical protein